MAAPYQGRPDASGAYRIDAQRKNAMASEMVLETRPWAHAAFCRPAGKLLKKLRQWETISGCILCCGVSKFVRS